MGKRYAIVGFGCAGYHALSALRESDHDAEIHVFSELDQPPANPMLTTYYAAGRLPFEALFPFGSLEEVAQRLSPVLHMDTRVTALDKDSRALVLADGERMEFDAVLLATGADPVVPPLGVTVGRRVLCMRTVADAKRLRQRLEAGGVRSVTVIGASMVGIKIVELCREAGLACTLADLAERVFPLAALPDVSAEIQRRLEEQGVALRFGAAVTAAEETENQVTTHFAQGEPVISDLLVLCIGTRARTELARAAGLEVDRGIVVNDSMETSAPGIYAAGDCCQGREIMSGGHQIIGLWANAGADRRPLHGGGPGDLLRQYPPQHHPLHGDGLRGLRRRPGPRGGLPCGQALRPAIYRGGGGRWGAAVCQSAGQLPHQRRGEKLYDEPLFGQPCPPAHGPAGPAGPRGVHRRIFISV